MTAPDRYDRRDPCPDCGEPACRCDDTWPEDDGYDPDDDEWADYCIRACPDDVCLASGHCAWPKPDPADYGLRAVRDLRTKGDVL